MQQHILAGLEAKGVDISTAKTLLQNGDTSGVSTWLAPYFAGNKGERMNATARSTMPSGMPFLREGKISARKTSLHAHMTGEAHWPGTSLPLHNGGMVKNATRCNSTAIIGDLEKKGVDVSAVKTALLNGDITTVTTWLKSYFGTHLNDQASRHTAWGHRNSTSLQGRP
jgi:hypothetical protein